MAEDGDKTNTEPQIDLKQIEAEGAEVLAVVASLQELFEAREQAFTSCRAVLDDHRSSFDEEREAFTKQREALFKKYEKREGELNTLQQQYQKVKGQQQHHLEFQKQSTLLCSCR